ncbi:alpha-glucosidase [Bifidobacterium vespertilionis]|uniref:Alpha-glucosidase n=1 Tax=Bifidobacterium vespertilionis TaxID=2562524 RepID=A0A5J5E1P4_9BIFI|nr:alpha-glucosidase [Bifidobacterium vespertilionis]KAA8818593.1 alpha-glucosidase [Bifidobacterium vespertilionis]KAA8823048.1 alpha-glucosidase [Bifidobacterium vespertilionis]
MTTPQRIALPGTVRTNGATPNPWWANAVVYQIYPRSFQDTNGDGFGDLKGITSRLDYLADLGVDVLWLSPVYKSPQDDNGYDISDYQDIDPLFGTLADMDELIAQAHRRGIKIVMDLVVNHTSDEHAWFQASRDKNDLHADWYWWRPARPGHEPGTPGAEPNDWGSYFGGSAWQYDETRGEYFLHQFSRKQPDLNWENPDVRRAVYDMMNWWLDRGVDGFRMDVITLISKQTDASGRLPGESGSQIPDLPVGEEGYSSPNPFCADGPRQDEFLAEMRREVFDGRNGFLTVGEAPGISPERNEHITDPANGELDMLFLFEHVDFDCDGVKWKPLPLDLPGLKRIFASYEGAVADRGWTALFTGNHDQPRVVSRWGDDSTEVSRIASAKAWGLALHMHRGTPYIYQGEELGMTNAHFTSLGQYRDLESLNAYRQRVEEAKVQTPESMMAGIAARGRDNARTPMQWDDSRYAGFTAPDAPVEPWIAVNPNHATINAAAEVDDSDSVYAFYKRLIALRHENPTVAGGDWTLIAPDDPRVYAFTRSLDGRSTGGHRVWDAERLLTVVNLSGESADLPADALALLPADDAIADGVTADRILIATGPDSEAVTAIVTGRLAPWQGFVMRL